MSSFRLTQPAIRDVEDIADYIASQSGVEQGDRFLGKLDANNNTQVTYLSVT
jgi:toxin ParE1/3/4